MSVCQWLQPWLVPSPHGEGPFPAVASYRSIPVWNVLLPAPLSALLSVFVCGCGSPSLICWFLGKDTGNSFMYCMGIMHTLIRLAQPCVCLHRGEHGIESEIRAGFLIMSAFQDSAGMAFWFFKCPVLNVNCSRMGFVPQLLWNFIEVSRDVRRGENGKGLCRAPS